MQELKLLTWNVNGLRAILRRKTCTLSTLLEELDADIACFQETKLTKADFTRELALVDGWDSYFSINRGRAAYSGVAIFCRRAVTVPLAAQEGVSGVLHPPSDAAGAGEDDLVQTGAWEAAATAWRAYTKEQLAALDGEGRCVATDHGAFVLFNLYGPAISSEESAEQRFAFKLEFYQALEVRVAALRRRGRRVVLVGDLNISPAPIDCCDPCAEFEARADRVWLRRLMRAGGGPFVDLFRLHHPDRRGAFTCWSQASGARANNWGTRIDLLLAADPPPGSPQDGLSVEAMATAADICPHVPASDHCPAWARLACACPLPAARAPFSTANLFTGRQHRLTAWLRPSAEAGGDAPQAAQAQPAAVAAAPAPAESTKAKGRQPVQRSLAGFVKRRKPSAEEQAPADADLARAIAASLAEAPVAEANGSGYAGAAEAGRAAAGGGGADVDALIAEDERQQAEEGPPAAGGGGRQDRAAAAAAWRALRERMRPPKCRGHGEECVIRTVKKRGPNCGRQFFVCRRADGAPPEGRCDYFQWAGARELRGGGSGAAAAAGKG